MVENGIPSPDILVQVHSGDGNPIGIADPDGPVGADPSWPGNGLDLGGAGGAEAHSATGMKLYDIFQGTAVIGRMLACGDQLMVDGDPVNQVLGFKPGMEYWIWAKGQTPFPANFELRLSTYHSADGTLPNWVEYANIQVTGQPGGAGSFSPSPDLWEVWTRHDGPPAFSGLMLLHRGSGAQTWILPDGVGRVNAPVVQFKPIVGTRTLPAGYVSEATWPTP